MGTSLWIVMMSVVALSIFLLVSPCLASLVTKHPEDKTRTWDCSSCGLFSDDLVRDLVSEHSVNGQVELLMPLCDALEDPTECQSMMAPFWIGLAAQMWPAWIGKNHFCEENCAKNTDTPRETCIECMQEMEYVESYLLSVKEEVYIIKYLDDYYCPIQGVMDVQECKDVMTFLIPRAMKAFYSVDREEINDWYWEFCDNIHNTC